jgi:hypothetical protein
MIKYMAGVFRNGCGAALHLQGVFVLGVDSSQALVIILASPAHRSQGPPKTEFGSVSWVSRGWWERKQARERERDRERCNYNTGFLSPE